VCLNDAFVSRVPLDPGQQCTLESDAEVSVPVTDPFSKAFSFNFAFQPVTINGCQTGAPIHLEGALLGSTTLDLSDYPHSAALPNLELFANAGLPFTRRSELSETTFIVPATPTRQEIETFLTLRSHFSRTTGFSALRLTVALADALHQGAQTQGAQTQGAQTQGAQTDFVIIGAGDDQPASSKLSSDLPMVLCAATRFRSATRKAFSHRSIQLDSTDQIASGSLATGSTPDAIVEAIKSSSGNDCSIVAIHLKDADAFDPFIAASLKKQQSREIHGSGSVVEGAQFGFFRIGAEVYQVLVLPGWIHLDRWFIPCPSRDRNSIGSMYFLSSSEEQAANLHLSAEPAGTAQGGTRR
jgi:cellulose synthase (UDP-forming)